MWAGGTKKWDLNPHTGGWPALSFYMTLGIELLYKAGYMASHTGIDAPTFARHVEMESRSLFLIARWISLLIGLVTVVLTFRLGRLLAGRTVGLAAALLLACNVPHILASQHVMDPNLLALLFLLLAATPMVRIATGEGTPRDSIVAGAMLGLAGACKYVPLLVMVPFLFAHPRGIKNRWFWAGAGIALVAMFAATPFTFLDWKTTFRDIVVQRKSLFSDWVGQSQFPISLPTYLVSSLPHALGWPTYLLSLVGTVLLWRTGAAGRAMAMIPIVMVAAYGGLRTAQERYILAAFPMFTIAAALAFTRAVAWWRERGPAALRGAAPATALALPALVAAGALVWPVPELARMRDSLRLPDSRHVARRWIMQNIPPTEPQMIELYGPVFQEGERNFVIWPFFATQAYLVSAAYHPEFLDGIRYAVLSREIWRRYEVDSLNYPRESAFYRWLHTKTHLVWSTHGMKLAGPVLEVRALPGSTSTEATRDSLFRTLVPKPTHTTRLALWCAQMAGLFGRMNQDDRAEEWALRGLSIEARNMMPQLYAALALSRLRLHRFAAAEEAARQGIAVTPRSNSLHVYRGMALEELGRSEEALEELRTAFALSNDPRILLNIGQLLADMGRFEEAVTTLAQVPSGIPQRAAAQRDLAVILINQLKRPDEGLAALREAAELETDPEQARLLREEVERMTRGR
jgi:tetratricopeptide (TPR) repeat protein